VLLDSSEYPFISSCTRDFLIVTFNATFQMQINNLCLSPYQHLSLNPLKVKVGKLIFGIDKDCRFGTLM
jgi:hypothetical protein